MLAQLFDLARAHLRALLELADGAPCPAAAELVALLERRQRRQKKAELNRAVVRQSLVMQLVQGGLPEPMAVGQVDAALSRT